MRAAPDEDVLEWAASEGLVLLTHDVTTMTRHTYDRIRAGQKMPGVLEVSTSAPYSVLIEDVLILVDCSIEGEWEWQVRYLPFTPVVE